MKKETKILFANESNYYVIFSTALTVLDPKTGKRRCDNPLKKLKQLEKQFFQMLVDTSSTRIDYLFTGEPCSAAFYVVDPRRDCLSSLVCKHKKPAKTQQAVVFKSPEAALESEAFKRTGRVVICLGFAYEGPDQVWYDMYDFARETNDDDEEIINMPSLSRNMGDGIGVYLVGGGGVEWSWWEDGEQTENDSADFGVQAGLREVQAVDPSELQWPETSRE